MWGVFNLSPTNSRISQDCQFAPEYDFYDKDVVFAIPTRINDLEFFSK